MLLFCKLVYGLVFLGFYYINEGEKRGGGCRLTPQIPTLNWKKSPNPKLNTSYVIEEYYYDKSPNPHI